MKLRVIRRVLTLERVINGAVLLSVLVAFTILCLDFAAKRARSRIEPGLARGKTLPDVANFHVYPKTLLLVLNTQCVYCKASIPFYQKLVAADRNAGSPVHIVAAFPNNLIEVNRFLGENGLEVDAVPDVQLAQLSVAATPSLILVNSKGEVVDFWLGKATEDRVPTIITCLFHLDLAKGHSP